MMMEYTKEKENNDVIMDPLLVYGYDQLEDFASARTDFMCMKSSLIFYMLHSRLGKGNLQKTISSIIVF